MKVEIGSLVFGPQVPTALTVSRLVYARITVANIEPIDTNAVQYH